MPTPNIPALGQSLIPPQTGSVEWWNQRAAQNPGNKNIASEAAAQAQLTAGAAGPQVGDVWTQQNANRESLYGGNFTPVGSVFKGGGTWEAPGTTKTVTLQDILGGKVPGMSAGISNVTQSGGGDGAGGVPSNLNAYTPEPDKYANPPANPGPLSYLGLPNYGNMGGNNSDNGFAGLFGAQSQGGFMSGWN